MELARITGSVVATAKVGQLQGHKLLVATLLDAEARPTEHYVVAVDTVGAGFGEVVLVVRGSSARQTDRTAKVPTDTTIVGIVDAVVFRGRKVYDKSSREESGA